MLTNFSRWPQRKGWDSRRGAAAKLLRRAPVRRRVLWKDGLEGLSLPGAAAGRGDRLFSGSGARSPAERGALPTASP